MKKQLKALLIAGIAASLAVMPVYGAGSASLGAVRYAYEPTDDDIAAGPGAVQQAAQEAAIAEAAQAEAEAAQAKKRHSRHSARPSSPPWPEPFPQPLPRLTGKGRKIAAFLAAAQANLQLGAVRKLDPSKPMIALTYDDGPQSSVGNRIMNVMNQYGGKCTFFMVGERVPAHAAEVQRMANEGFEVANHTQNHKYLNRVSAAEIHAQVNACNDTSKPSAASAPR